MTITDESRYRLHQRLEQLLGPDEAATLMEHLPPVGWADVATKHDLRHEIGLLRAELGGELRSEIGCVRAEFGGLRAEFDGLRADFERLRAEVQRDLRLQLLAIMGFNSALVAATYAVARLA